MDECTSTNDLASRLADDEARHGFVVVAERQARGRGRQGRTWMSLEGGIWLTTVLRPPANFEPLDGLPLMGALAVCLTLTTKFGIKALVRWPNDVTFQGSKLAGTLVEAKSRGNALAYVLLGLGLDANFHTKVIAGEVENATTLLDTLGSAIDRAESISCILLDMERLYDQMNSGDSSQILGLLKQNESSRGRRVIVQLEGERLVGAFEDYETLTRVSVQELGGNARTIETSSVIFVEYPGASGTPLRSERQIQ